MDSVDVYYLTTAHDDYKPRYVGKSMRPQVRLSQHTKYAHKKRSSKLHAWIFARVRDGHEIIMCRLESNVTTAEEVHWIKTLRELGCDLLNLTNGGDGGPMPHEVIERTKLTKASREYPNRIGPRGERSGRAKLTEEDVRAIRRDYKPTIVTAKMLAARYGVGWKAIVKIVHR